MGMNLDVKEISVSHRLPTRGESYSSRLRLAQDQVVGMLILLFNTRELL